MLEAAIGNRAEAFDGADRLEGFEPGQQVPEDRLDLGPGDVRAHAEVLPEPEREVRVRVAVDPECERVLEYVFVPVGRGEVERELFALADGLAPDLCILRRNAWGGTGRNQ